MAEELKLERPNEIVPYLCDILEKGNSDARADAAEALGRVVRKEADLLVAVPPLIRALKDADALVRVKAADAL